MVFALISGPVLTKYGVEEDMCEAKLVSLAQDTDLTFPSSIGKWPPWWHYDLYCQAHWYYGPFIWQPFIYFKTTALIIQ